MTAPIFDEIRATVEAGWASSPSSSWAGPCINTLAGVIDVASNALEHPSWVVLDPGVRRDIASGVYGDPEDESDLWTDLRVSEAVRLRDLVEAAKARATERCKAIILDELTAAGVAFAAEHPAARRPVR